MKTVYVVGSGASSEAGLPTGAELKNHIAKLLNIKFQNWEQKSGDYTITQALRSTVHKNRGGNGDINPYLHEAWHIVDALPLAISIDNFLDAHKDNACIEFLGKIAIASSILTAESKSKLVISESSAYQKMNFEKIKDTWYIPFFQLLTENCSIADLEDRFSKLVLIIFNYDRCVEHFLMNALKRYYNLDDHKAWELVQTIEIYHPYGKTGNLNWQSSSNAIPFGSIATSEQLLQLVQGIRTFTEGTNPESSEIVAIRKHISESSSLVFLGFAFHQLNIELLTPQDLDPKDDNFRCFASALDISRNDCDAIQQQINSLFSSKVNVSFANLTCNSFFKEFWRSLAFSDR